MSFNFMAAVTICSDFGHGAQRLALSKLPGTGPSHCRLPAASLEEDGSDPFKVPPLPGQSLVPGDLPDAGIKPGLLHCRQILYCLSHWGSPYSDLVA